MPFVNQMWLPFNCELYTLACSITSDDKSTVGDLHSTKIKGFASLLNTTISNRLVSELKVIFLSIDINPAAIL